MNQNCVFCKIVKKEIPCHQIYEDDRFLAFLDIQPVADGHLLIIPKEHVVWMQEADDDTIARIFKIAKKLMQAIKSGIGCDYVMVSVVGTDVPHFHVHLIPRYFDDNHPKFPTKEFQKELAQEVADKIIRAL